MNKNLRQKFLEMRTYRHTHAHMQTQDIHKICTQNIYTEKAHTRGIQKEHTDTGNTQTGHTQRTQMRERQRERKHIFSTLHERSLNLRD